MILFGQLIISDFTAESLWQRTSQIIIYIGMCISVDCRNQHNQKRNDKYHMMFCDKPCNSTKIRKNYFMSGLFDCLIADKNQGRKNRYTSDNTKDNTLCHNDTKVFSKGKAHKTQCDKSGNCCNGAADHGSNCIGNRMCHGTVFISVKPLLLLLITVPQENGIIHCNTELQYRRQCLGNIRNLPEKYVGTQIVNNCHADTDQKQERNNYGIHRK